MDGFLHMWCTLSYKAVCCHGGTLSKEASNLMYNIKIAVTVLHVHVVPGTTL